MTKIYRASISFDIYPDENGLFDWMDEDETPMTEEQLIDFARSEMFEYITNGMKYNEIWDYISVDVVDVGGGE